ncbi:beta strand repeat-containing protein [Shewanella halifaxensis]|uniref:beta strand repeat-containing protein n=1 Tax=Shewanella halifaxensis TaxID=271098 RepID=UPI000D591103|nr:thrombospondin type 3 repeat-containing protein [Shewanella halifaxensis]
MQLKNLITLLFYFVVGCYAQMAQASAIDSDDDGVSDALDVDIDGDGLIEISTLVQFNNIRNNLAGTAYNDGGGDNETGCGNGSNVTECSGYELVSDLDFDGNANGDLSDEPYWNAGEGWEPIGSSASGFASTLEGNGFGIFNLFINRSSTDNVGLFAALDGAIIRNITFAGDLLSVTGKSRVAIVAGNHATSAESQFSGLTVGGTVAGVSKVGAIYGHAEHFQITNSHVSTQVIGTGNYIGGLVGEGGDSSVSFIASSGFTGSVTGVKHIGGMVGGAYAVTASYSYVNGSVSSSDSYTGGIFGSSEYGVVEHSFVLGDITSADSYAGGLIGYGDSATITDSFSSATVIADDYAAGLIAYSEYALSITNSFATGAVSVTTASGPDSGGIVADLSPVPFTESSVYWDVESSGQLTSENNQGVGYSTTDLQAPTSNTGIYATWSASDWDFGTASQYPALKNQGLVFRDADNDGYWQYEDAFDNDPTEHLDSDSDNVGDNRDVFPNDPNEWADNDNDGVGNNADTDDDNDNVLDVVDNCPFVSNVDQTSSDEDGLGDACDVDKDGDGLIEIGTLAEFYNIRNNLAGTAYNDGGGDNVTGCGNGSNVTECSGYELVSDLDFDGNGNGDLSDDPYWNAGEGWEPIGSSASGFASTLEGNGFGIFNLFINRPSTDNVGLFAALDGAIIRNITFAGDLLSVTGKSRVAIVAGNHATSAESQFSGLTVGGTVAGVSKVGAIYGHAEHFQITNSHVSTQVIGTGNYIGGLVGEGGDSSVSFIASSGFTGSVTGVKHIGGMVGGAYAVTASYSYVNGSVSSSDSYTGGIFGSSEYGVVEHSFVLGDITSADSYAGGLIGYGDSATITDSFSSATVIADDYAAGLIAYSEYALSITNSFATGAVSVTTASGPDSGGIVADLSPVPFTESSVYWDVESSGQLTSENNQGVGYSTTDLQAPTSNTGIYATWSASDWDFGTASQYPALKNQGLVFRDADNDGYWQYEDAFDNDPTEHLDSDSDNVGDNRDVFPNDPNEWADFDNDGIGDNADTDDDNDGVEDSADDFPNDAGRSETDAVDTDNDTVDDNLDVDVDGDGLIEISTLVELNNVRNNLSGTAYNDGTFESSNGCGNNNDVLVCFGYELTASLNFDENGDKQNNDTFNSSEGWLPLGDSFAPFSATFDGNDFKLINFFIANTSLTAGGDSVGVFGDVKDGVIRNLHVKGSITAASEHVGGIAGNVYGDTGSIVSNVSFIGDITHTGLGGNTGGLIGELDDSKLSQCVASISISSIVTVGGLVGYPINSEIENCIVMGALDADGGSTSGGVSGTSFSTKLSNVAAHVNIQSGTAGGGLVGNVSGAYSNIDNSFSTSIVRGGNVRGGAFASGANSIATDVYWDTDTSGLSSSDGGTGYTTAELQSPTSNSGIYSNWDPAYWSFGTSSQYPTPVINGVIYIDTDEDGIVDSNDAFPNDPSEDTDSDRDSIGDNADAFPNDPTEWLDTDGDGIGNNSDPDIDGDGVANESDLFPLDASGSVAADDVDIDDDGLIEIYTLADLDAMRNDLSGGSLNGVTAGCAGLTDGSGCNGYELMADLDFDTNGNGDLSDESYYNAGEGWLPIGSSADKFTANFDGNGYTISNLMINRPNQDYQALLGYVSTISVSNINIGGELTSITGLNNSATLIARNTSSDSASLLNIRVNGSIIGNDDSGLVAGKLYNLSANQVHATGDITAISITDEDGDDAGSDVGGLFGQLSGVSVLSFVSFEGNIQGTNSAGGLVGDAESVTISDSYAVANILLVDNTGIETDLDNAGGLLGYAEGTNVLSRVFAQGSILASTNVGGLVGHLDGSSTITDAVADVAITGDSEIGGLIGNLDADSTISRILALGAITTNDGLNTNAGGILGYSAGSTLSYSYARWDREATGISSTFANQGTSFSSAELKCPISPTDVSCNSTPYDNTWLITIWNFGTSEQYPAMIFNSNVYRDADGDGYWVFEDAFENDATEHLDSDSDNVGDNADAFPNDPTETVDSDNDGIGDNADAFPNDPTETVDSDNDGVGDNADAFPNDPNQTEDTTAPVIEGLVDIIVEATSEFTEVDVTQPNVIDDVDLSPVLSVDYDSFTFTVGEHILTWTATDVAGNESTAAQKITIVDTTAPAFDSIDSVEFNAEGIRTNIKNRLEVYAFDLVDGEVKAMVNSTDEGVVSGRHLVELEAKDNAGNSALTSIVVDILPELSVATQLDIEAGQNYAIDVLMSGDAAIYPVQISYSLVINGYVDNQLVASIEEGQSGLLLVDIADTLSSTDVVEVHLDNSVNAFIDDASVITLQVKEDNVAPSINLSIEQSGANVAVVDLTEDIVTVNANLFDINNADNHDIIWLVNNAQIVDIEADADSFTFQFDPSLLEEGVYQIGATVAETNTDELFTITKNIQFIVSDLPELSNDMDSDNDGIVDSEEGYVDSDGDGIANYLDNDSNTSRLPTNENTAPIQTEDGLTLSLGSLVSRLGSTVAAAVLTMDELASLVDADAADTNDVGYKQKSLLFNFVIDGLTELGSSAAIVLPLAKGNELPAGAVYRKYTMTLGWYTFVEDANNSVSSAMLDVNGNCPTANDAAYVNGLIEGHHCIQLIIEDGGPNDADGLINRSVEDPGYIAVEASTVPENNSPVIVMGSHASAFNEAEVITLSASISDQDGDILSILWEQISGPEILFHSTDSETISLTLPAVDSDEVVELKVTVSDGSLSQSIMTKFTILAQDTPLEPEPEVTPDVTNSGGAVGWLFLLLLVAWLFKLQRSNRLYQSF